MASLAPNSLYYRLGTGAIDLDGDSFKIALFTSSFSIDIDSHDDYSDLSNECPATGNYTTGGAAITLTWTQDNTDDRAELTAADVTFSNLTQADYQYAVIYDDTTTPKYIIRTIDYGSAKSVTGTDLTLSFPNQVLQLGSA